MTQAIRLLSSGPFPPPTTSRTAPALSLSAPSITDPFSSAHLTYTTTGADAFPSPSSFESRRHAWLHVFPEGKIHQDRTARHMRYFKWGVARLILEAEPCPDLVPIWIEGPDDVMHEERRWPRFVPRPFRGVSVTFGRPVDVEGVFGDLRERWRELRRRDARDGRKWPLGELSEELKYGEEAVDLRMECTMRVRREVLKVRKRRGWPDEDPKAGWVDTYMREGPKREGRMDDGTIVKDM